MRKEGDGRLVVSPTDLTKFLACQHLTALDLAVAEGTGKAPHGAPDELLELIFAKGLQHEARYLEQLRSVLDVVEIEVDHRNVALAAAQTEAAMRAGAEVIYQATFFHEGRRGHADFLLRSDAPSDLGVWSYDIADTKLSRRLKVPALLQMASYGEHLRRIQGSPPVTLTVVAGNGEQHAFAFADVESYARRVAARFDEFVTDGPATVADPVLHCEQCRWAAQCNNSWRKADHLTFVASLGSHQRHILENAGVTTLLQLATADPTDLPKTIGAHARERLVGQARLQVEERSTLTPVYELLAPADGQGLLKLPEPDEADLYLDFESDRWVEPDGLEYLAGVGDRDDSFTAIWAHDADQERRLTETLVDSIVQRWASNPGMHVYHYAPYETAALRRLTARHGTREAELDILLRAEVFVDLYAVVRQGLRISKESYSIKKLEAFYWGGIRGRGDTEVAEAISSVLAYERWLTERDNAILQGIAAYNFDDVRSTHHLHDWLEQRRTELEHNYSATFARPSSNVDADAAQPGDAERVEISLAETLLSTGHPLLSGLVGWHRREARPAWWDFFRLEDLDIDELIDDRTAVGGLGAPLHQYDIARSHVHRYEFPPQDTTLTAGAEAIEVDDHARIGVIVDIDPIEGWVDIKVSKTTTPATPRGIGGTRPINDGVLRGSIAATAEHVLEGHDCLGARLLDRQVPPGLPVRAAESATDALHRVGADLGCAVLAVQGPPGTGKTHNGAELIRSLLDRKLRVGVTAQSHQVIGNLLLKVDRPALQRCNEDHQLCGSPAVARASSTAEVVDAFDTGTHRLVGGTAWLWATDALEGAVDVLVIDEAGQFSLANAVAAARCAKALILLGDPQQLTQPTQAQHPHGSGVSALEHMLTGHPTIPTDRGVFLDRTWRMHPSVTDFISTVSYEGRLVSRGGLERQAVGGSGPLSGSGLRMVPVAHQGNSSASVEEASVVADLVGRLLGRDWTDQEGTRHELHAADVLVVAPYNAHVACLRAKLPNDLAIGTVDKFQGREAAVVIYSLASSSAADAPRGIEFLYDVHRLNVAVSRARAMTIVVCSPTLLDAEATTPRQVRLVNALCRYAETAEVVTVDSSM